MLGMDKSVERLWLAICAGEKLSIHGDYDVDGISATTLLVEFLARSVLLSTITSRSG